MKIRTVLLAGASLLALTTHAYSFEAIGILIVNVAFALPGGVPALAALFPAGASAATIGAAAVSTALSLGGLAVSFLNQPKLPTQKIKQTTQGAEGPGITLFGRAEAKGRILFGRSTGYYHTRLVAHAFGPVSTIEAYFYDGREITVEPDGLVSSPPWAYWDPGGGWDIAGSTGSFMNVLSQVGDGTEEAFASMLTDFPSTWTAAHRNIGLAQSRVRIRSPGTQSDKFGRLLQGGVKELSVRGRWLEPYDPRIDGYQWTINGVLWSLHFLRQLGMIDDEDIDFDDIGATATLGEATVTTKTGTTQRCQVSGGWEGPLTLDIVADIMQSSGLELYQTAAGKWSLRFIEDWPEPEISIPASCIVAIYPQAGPDNGKRATRCTLSYFSPERRYERAEVALHEIDTETDEYKGAGWARLDDEAEELGEQEFPCDLTYTCHASLAQRLARQLFYLARADAGLLVTNFAGIAAWGRRTALIEFPDIGEDGASVWLRARLGAVRPNDAEGTVEIPFKLIPEILATPFNPTTDEVDPPPVLVPPITESDLTKPPQPTAACVVQYPDGTRELRVATETPSGAAHVEAVFRVWDAGGPLPGQSMTEVELPGAADFAWRQIKYNIFTNPDTWSGWTLGTGWAASPPYLVATAGTQSAANQTHAFTAGLSYDFIVTISDRTAGVLRPRFGGGGAVEGTDISTNGTFTQTLVAASGSSTANFRKDASFNGKLSAPKLYHTGDHPVLELGSKVDFRKRIFDGDGNASEFSDALVVESIAIDNTPLTTLSIASERVLIDVGGGETYAYDRVVFTVTALRTAAYQVSTGPIVKTRPGTYTVDIGPVDPEDPAATYPVVLYVSDGTPST